MLQRVSWKLSNKRLVNRKKELLFFSFGLILFFILLSFSKIKQVDCFVDNLPCPEILKAQANNFLDKSFLFVSKKKVENELKKFTENKTMAVSIHPFQKVSIQIQSNQNFYPINYALIQDLPILSFEASPTSTISAQFFEKPSTEIVNWSKSQSWLSFELHENGSLAPVATASSKYYFFTQKKPTEDFLKKTYTLMKLLEMYTYDTEIYYLIENTLYLQKTNSPDIIISSTSSEENVLKALQHLGFITTIKKDPKIIDLRYKNPIIR